MPPVCVACRKHPCGLLEDRVRVFLLHAETENQQANLTGG